MPKASATRELLAPPEDVWAFLAEPYHLSDWWPGVRGVQPDRRGLAPGARWELTASQQGRGFLGSVLGSPRTTRTLVVMDVRTNALLRLLFAEDGIEAEIRLEPANGSRTTATVTVEGGWIRLNHSMPRTALNRLHDLCQTAAEL